MKIFSTYTSKMINYWLLSSQPKSVEVNMRVNKCEWFNNKDFQEFTKAIWVVAANQTRWQKGTKRTHLETVCVWRWTMVSFISLLGCLNSSVGITYTIFSRISHFPHFNIFRNSQVFWQVNLNISLLDSHTRNYQFFTCCFKD